MVPGSGWETMQWLQFQVANKAKYQTPSAISQKKGNLYPPKKPWPFMTQLHLDTPFWVVNCCNQVGYLDLTCDFPMFP